jgi:integrase/recombinase XerD
MTVAQGIESFLSHLKHQGYSPSHLERQGRLLRGSFQYRVALHHPEIPRWLTKLLKEAASSGVSDPAVGQFLQDVGGVTESVRYISLAALASEHSQLLPRNSRAVFTFLQGLGGSVELTRLTEGLIKQISQTPFRSSEELWRMPGVVQAFLEFCHERGWVSWNPQLPQRFPGMQVLETDFFGPSNARWADHARSYLRHLKDQRNLALGGLDFCARKLKPFVEWLDAEGVDDLQLSKLQAFIDFKRSQGVSETTLSKYLHYIRAFVEYLIGTKRIPQHHNPAAELRIKIQAPARRQILSEGEFRQLIEYLENAIHRTANPQRTAVAVRHFHAVRDLALVLLFVLCGLRLSEVARMGVEDVLIEKKALRIQGKGNRQARSKVREILLEAHAWKRLKDYLRIRAHRSQRYLWIAWNGRPLRPGGIRKVVHARLKEAGLSGIVSPHGLRATCASLYVKKGMDPYSLKTLLGHESLKTTMDSYARLTEDQLREVWKKTNPLAGYDDE